MQLKGKKVFNQKILISEKSFQDLTSTDTDLKECDKDDTQMIAQLLKSQISEKLENICFMDMRAEETLKPADV